MQAYEPKAGVMRLSRVQLSLGQLNRATLARQHLLARSELSVPQLLEQMAGLNAQAAYQPYISLWSRLQQFEPGQLEEALAARRVVKATLMRSTLHMVTGADFLAIRAGVQPVLERAFRAHFRQEAAALPLDRIQEKAAALTRGASQTFPQLRRALAELAPGADPASLSFAARAYLPLVQVPPAGTWGFQGVPPYRCGETWLDGSTGDAAAGRRRLVEAYLQGFGPAGLADLTRWAGFSLRGTAQKMKGRLVTYEGPNGQQLVDLAGLPVPAADEPAPPRLLPSWDNVLLAYKEHARVLPPERRSRVIGKAGVYAPTILLDGIVAGTWTWETEAGEGRLTLNPFDPVDGAEGEALRREALRLLRFLAPDAAQYRVIVRAAGASC